MIRAALVLFVLTFSAMAADVAGEYTGTYSSTDNSYDGKLRTVLAKSGDSAWDCKFFFNNGGDEIATKTTSCSVDETKIKAEYEADVDGTALQVTMEATWLEDHSLQGTYKTLGVSGNVIDQGKWKASKTQ